MQRFESLLVDASKKLKIADHMITMSYPLVEDPKILFSASTNIFSSMELAMTALLEVERLFKRIQPYANNFQSKLTVFIKMSDKHGIKKEHLELLKELYEIKEAHKKSPVEFSRKDKFVICSNTYEMKTIELKDLKNMINKAKLFIEQISINISKNNGILR